MTLCSPTTCRPAYTLILSAAHVAMTWPPAPASFEQGSVSRPGRLCAASHAVLLGRVFSWPRLPGRLILVFFGRGPLPRALLRLHLPLRLEGTKATLPAGSFQGPLRPPCHVLELQRLLLGQVLCQILARHTLGQSLQRFRGKVWAGARVVPTTMAQCAKRPLLCAPHLRARGHLRRLFCLLYPSRGSPPRRRRFFKS